MRLAARELHRSPCGAPGALPATKKELPWLTVAGGRLKTTLFYGPWQCNRRWMNSCQRECTSEGLQLKGCMWLGDIKLDWQGSHLVLPLPVEAGGRYAITHCCCSYPALSPVSNATRRKEWENFRESYREGWSKKFGKWPETDGVAWPGHHIRDLQHGGDPVDPSNIIPTQPDVHKVFNKAYPDCYAGMEPWSRVGPDLPYRDK
jgi:hypothetical protein